MKANYLIPVFIVCLLFSSCSDNDDPGDINRGTGQEATIKFTFKLPPSSKGTRADIAGNDAENEIEGIMIYVYDQAGNPPSDPEKGSFGPYSLEDDFDLTNGVYEMKTPVKTTDGNKHIYVVANANITATPSNNLGAFGTESELLGRRYDVHKGRAGSQNGLINYNTANPPELTHIVFAGNTTKELVAGSETNEVTIDIERTVSRVIVTCDEEDGFTGEWTEDNDYTLKVVNFLVKQDAYKGVVGQNYYTGTNSSRKKTLISETAQADWYDIINPYSPAYYLPAPGGQANDIDEDYIAIEADPGNNAGRVALKGSYIGENVTNTPDKEAQHGNTTYAWIQTTLTLQNTAVVNGDDIVYTGAALDGTQTFYLVRVRGVVDYICNPANYAAVAQKLHENHPGDVTSYQFPAGYIYYRVFLNGVDADANAIGENDKYNVYRNQFIHLDIRGAKMSGDPGDPDDPEKPGNPGGFGPGYPGSPPTDPNNPNDPAPKVPIDPLTPTPGDPSDPTKPGEGGNPNPHLPEDPIDEDDATLTINITIKPWEYMQNGIILE